MLNIYTSFPCQNLSEPVLLATLTCRLAHFILGVSVSRKVKPEASPSVGLTFILLIDDDDEL